MITKAKLLVFLNFHCNDFSFTFNIAVSYLGIFIRHPSMMLPHPLNFSAISFHVFRFTSLRWTSGCHLSYKMELSHMVSANSSSSIFSLCLHFSSQLCKGNSHSFHMHVNHSIAMETFELK